MSSLKLYGSTSGYVEVAPEATAQNNSITIPNTAGTIAVKDASGNLGIGTDSTTVFGTAYRTVQLNPASGSGDGSAIRFMYDGGTANTNDLVIYTNTSQSYIRANGARNIDVMRNGSTVATFNANGIAVPSGLGIDFSAATGSAAGSTSALLDDYEEGTWTPTVGGTTTYTTQEGRYTKIGRMVHLVGVLIINTIGTGSQNIVSGLPFTNGTPGQATVNINYYSSSNVTTTWISGYVEPNTSNFRFSGNDGNANAADANISFLSASTGIYFSLTYQV